jgi:uncharacterized protein (DUF1697 family)
MRPIDAFPVAHVVFLRGANVGGKNVFRPAQFAAGLAHLGVVNIGAAGTFVVRGRASPARIRREFLAGLSFDPNLVIKPADEILALVRSRPFQDVEFTKQMRGWVAVLCGPPKAEPALPVILPVDKEWSFRFERIDGAFAFGLWHLRPRGFIIPSNALESSIGVAVTTRWWETYERIAKAIEAK